MTEEENAIAKLKAIEGASDPKTEHLQADAILCEFLRSLGYARLADQFEEQARFFWYA
jgi:hypothetical protein